MELLEFYPTPKTLLDKVLDGIKWSHIGSVLEPSAGKGDIVKHILETSSNYPHYNRSLDVDCIEKEKNLQKIIKGNEYKLVHDDFLTYHTFKQYDLIVMNPPFSDGDKHLNKALDMQERTGGDVICILNAETIKNPYTNLRKALIQRLDKAGAEIEFMEQAFSSAERSTDVEIAVVKVHYEKPEFDSSILDSLKQKYYSEACEEENAELASGDIIDILVKSYNMELEAGINLIKEYWALAPKIKSALNTKDNPYSSPLIKMKVGEHEVSINEYVELTRMKYWEALFNDRRITGNMTSNLQTKYRGLVNKLKDYDFSVYNIKQIQIEMSQNLVSGVEDCIISLFDELSHQYSYYDSSSNIHLYNGWKTNKAWIINKKVIIPFYDAFDRFDGRFQPTYYKVVEKLSDIEKALNYLDGGLTDDISLSQALEEAKTNDQTKNISLKYFDITFYKKGTCHIVFKNEELLKKFNIFGSRKKGWLPPSYGKKRYSDMTEEEKSTIDEFEGKNSYERVLNDSDYYLFDTSRIAMLEEKTA